MTFKISSSVTTPISVSVAREHNGQPFSGALHPAQRDFQPRIFVEKQRGRHVRGDGLLQIQIVAKQQRAEHEQSGDAIFAIAHFQDRQAGKIFLTRQLQRDRERRLRFNRHDLRERRGDLPHA